MALSFLLVDYTSAANWYRIENSHFDVLSDAKPRKVLKILDELERFRVATEQFVNIDIPEDAPRTRVTILRSRRAFYELVGSQFVAGVMFDTPDGPMFVMSSSKPKYRYAWDPLEVMRHEYVHIISSYDDVRYPRWYNEGFAELLATAEIHDDYMLVGTYDKANALSLYSWTVDDEMFEDGYRYEPHYGWYWLFTHYLAFGSDRQDELVEYLNLYAAGTPPLEAFYSAFGLSPSEMWKQEVHQYREIPVYRVPIDLSKANLDFVVSDADPDQVNKRMRFLEARFSRGR